MFLISNLYIHIYKFLTNSISLWINWELLNSTNSRSINSSNLDISMITPISSPWISNEIEFNTILNSITNSKYCMIKGCTTTFICNNAWEIMLEWIFSGINCYWYRLLSNSSFQLIFWVFKNTLIRLNFNWPSIRSITWVCHCCVGINIFSCYWIWFSIVKTIFLPSSIAA